MSSWREIIDPSGNILSAAHSVIRNNQGRKPKKLWTEKDEGEKVHYFRAEDDKDEARYVAYEVDKLCGRGRKYSDFAVLYRTNVQSRLFEEAFRSGNSYRILGGFRYYDRKEVKDMVAYMRLVQNPADDLFGTDNQRAETGNRAKDAGQAQNACCGPKPESLSNPDGSGDHARIAGQSGENLFQLAETISRLSQEQDNLKISDIYDVLLVRTGIYKH